LGVPSFTKRTQFSEADLNRRFRALSIAATAGTKPPM
jgi:hypothetical protein